eukprot:270746-Chlamydomonas_euryale.AAC.7
MDEIDQVMGAWEAPKSWAPQMPWGPQGLVSPGFVEIQQICAPEIKQHFRLSLPFLQPSTLGFPHACGNTGKARMLVWPCAGMCGCHSLVPFALQELQCLNCWRSIGSYSSELDEAFLVRLIHQYSSELAEGLLALLFQYDDDSLETMLTDVLDGVEWQGVVLVPASLRRRLLRQHDAVRGPARRANGLGLVVAGFVPRWEG